jgi:hypothetical protein
MNKDFARIISDQFEQKSTVSATTRCRFKPIFLLNRFDHTFFHKLLFNVVSLRNKDKNSSLK